VRAMQEGQRQSLDGQRGVEARLAELSATTLQHSEEHYSHFSELCDSLDAKLSASTLKQTAALEDLSTKVERQGTSLSTRVGDVERRHGDQLAALETARRDQHAHVTELATKLSESIRDRTGELQTLLDSTRSELDRKFTERDLLQVRPC
jgi:DNA-binding SARP family transcriptional activator